MRDDVGQIVIDSLVLRRQFLKEQMSQILDSFILITQTLCHFSQLTLDFDHTVQDEMSEHHQSVLLDREILVVKSSVKSIRVFVHNRREANGDISKSDDNVGSNCGFSRGFEDLEEEHEVFGAEFRRDTHKLRQGESCGSLEHRVLSHEIEDESSLANSEKGRKGSLLDRLWVEKRS